MAHVILNTIKINPPFLCSHAQWTPAAVGPDCTNPSPAAPLAETPWSTDALAPCGPHRGPCPDQPEKLTPSGAGQTNII